MKYCDRCFLEYEDEEIIQFDKESPKWICKTCKWEFDHRLKVFLIEFFNSQPERLNEKDTIYEEIAEYGSKSKFGLLNSICDSPNTSTKGSESSRND